MTKTKKNISVQILNILIPVILAFALGGIAIGIAGQNPFVVYAKFFSSAFGTRAGWVGTLTYATPLILTGLAIAVSFKANLFNMGVEGQMYLGAFAATWLGFSLNLPSGLHIIVCLVFGMIVGAAFAFIPGILKAKYHVNEMVVSLMLNYVAQIFTKFLTNGPFKQNIGYSATQQVNDSAMLPRLGSGTQLNIGLFIALGAFVVMLFLYRKNKFGYELEAIGKNVEFSDAVGMRVDHKILWIMMISGALAGLAGGIEILGVHKRFNPTFSSNPGLGWDGMLVALLGANNPIGVLIAAIFFGAMKYGASIMQTQLGLPADVINIIQSLLILFLSVRFLSQQGYLNRWLSKLRKKDKNTADIVEEA